MCSKDYHNSDDANDDGYVWFVNYSHCRIDTEKDAFDGDPTEKPVVGTG